MKHTAETKIPGYASEIEIFMEADAASIIPVSVRIETDGSYVRLTPDDLLNINVVVKRWLHAVAKTEKNSIDD